MKRIGILSSHNGSGFLAVQKACEEKILNAQVVVVVSNNSEANVLKKASSKNIPNFVINSKKFPDEDLDLKITNLFKEFEVDFILLSGYMKKLEKNLITNFDKQIINSHPALLPNYGGKGMYGKFVHEAVIKNGDEKSGCTIHFVNENYDEGEYILQKSVSLQSDETVETLEEKIKSLESQALVDAFKKLII